jgi:two-component system response regulator AtoC
MKRILVIDDEANMRHMLAALLSGKGYTVETASDGKVALESLERQKFDFVLCDIKMPKMDGMAFLQSAVQEGFEVTIIMMSAFGAVDTAIEAMKNGAYDYISKPFKADEIVLVLKKAEERERLRAENVVLRKKIAGLEQKSGLDKMIGKSRVMQELFELADKVARHLTTVLITGESGTGKELVARGIHNKSPRCKKDFVAINCGSIPENLLESELFGYVKGAFTGADRDKVGLFEVANGATLFLDEIGELPLSMQVKLLRVLQEQEIRRIGAASPAKIDVRVIAATSKNLADDVRHGRFREDLYYRLNVVELHVPPLRERAEDIPLLSNHFINVFASSLDIEPIEGISSAAMKLLLTYHWPGNVRELENAMERAVVLTNHQQVRPENLPEKISGRSYGRRLDDILCTFSLKEGRKILEQRLISRALEATAGNKSRASELLEISYPSLLSKIKEYELSR